MLVPGSNLLKLAMTVIGHSTVNWFQFESQGEGPTGASTATYAAPATIPTGTVQPVDRKRYEELGLDLQRSYINWYVPNIPAQSISRTPDNSGDVIEWPVNNDGTLIAGKSRRYQIVGDMPWTNVDSWTNVIGQDIGPATGATTNA